MVHTMNNECLKFCEIQMDDKLSLKDLTLLRA